MKRPFFRCTGPFLVVLFMCAALLACGGGGGGDAPAPPPNCTLEFNGDSIGVGPALATPPLAALHALQPMWSITDKALEGLTLNSLANGYATAYVGGPVPKFGAQLPFAQVTRTAHVVVIELGGNDALVGRSVAEFEVDLRETIRIIRSEGRAPVLTGIVNLPGDDVYFTAPVRAQLDAMNAVTLRLAVELGIPHAGWHEDYRGPGDVISDQIHRTQPASDRLVAQLANTLAVVSPACARQG